MADDEHYTDIDISDVIDNADNLIDTDQENLESENLDPAPMEANDGNDEEFRTFAELGEAAPEKKQALSKVDTARTTRLPVARVKNIMKSDPDVHMVNAEAVFLVTKATELFLETLAKETYAYTAAKKRRTIVKKDLDATIGMIDCLCFLEGALDF